jgi:hypothetical protein
MKMKGPRNEVISNIDCALFESPTFFIAPARHSRRIRGEEADEPLLVTIPRSSRRIIDDESPSPMEEIAEKANVDDVEQNEEVVNESNANVDEEMAEVINPTEDDPLIINGNELEDNMEGIVVDHTLGHSTTSPHTKDYDFTISGNLI